MCCIVLVVLNGEIKVQHPSKINTFSKYIAFLKFLQFAAFRCVLTHLHQGRKTSAMILEKQLLLPINLGRVIRSFLHYLESIVLEIFTSGKTFKTAVNLPRTFTSNPRAKSDSTGLSMLKFMTEPVACLEGLQDKD